jgi:P4 family phage/plasmid primase-like protien
MPTSNCSNTSAKDQLALTIKEVSAVEFLTKFSGDNLIVLTSIVPDGFTTTRTFSLDETEEMQSFITGKNQNENIYFSVNPVNDRIRKKASKSDIKEIAWLHVDIDPDKGMDLEESRKQILNKLNSSPLKATVIIDSGNGYQAFFKLSIPIIVNGNIQSLENENKRIENYFQADSCHNIDRVMRVPGTLNHPNKKKVALGRTVAEAELVCFGDEEYSIDDFSVFGDLPESNALAKDEKCVFEPVDEEATWEKFEELCRVDSDVRKRWEGDPTGLTDRSGSGFDMALASLLKRRGFSISETRMILREYIYGKGLDMSDDYFKLTWKKAQAGVRKKPALTDAGNAERFAELYQNELIYVEKWKCWLHWNGIRWERINQGISEFAIEVAKDIFKELDGIHDLKIHKKISSWAYQSQSAPRLEAMTKLAKGKLIIEPDKLDADTWLLNCRNGILDLKQGKLLPHDPQKLLTNLCDVEFDPEAKCPKWENFIEETTSGDQELIDYLQRIFGYCLTGETVEQAMFIFQGPGSNGKSTFLETIKFILGDYAVKAQADSFMKKRNERINNDIAGLAGVRLAIASEIVKGRELDESLVKELTGGDSITARKLYSENFTFTPQFKILLGLNDPPEIKGTDNGIWRRIRLIKFDHIVPKEKVDMYLMQKLQKEASGILAWALKGCMAWQNDGLAEPELVKNTTKEYREDSDTIQLYINKNIEMGNKEDPEFWTEYSDIYEDYKNFPEASGSYTISKKAFTKEMESHGYLSVSKWFNNKNRTIFKGLKIAKNPQSGFSAIS